VLDIEGLSSKDASILLRGNGDTATIAVGSTLRFMCQNQREQMEEDVVQTLRWTEAYLQTKRGFGNRIVEDGRAEVAEDMLKSLLHVACCMLRVACCMLHGNRAAV